MDQFQRRFTLESFVQQRRMLSAVCITLATTIAACSYGGALWRHGFDQNQAIDDAAWIYSSYYFRLAFLQFDLLSDDWSHFDAYDHPPVMKYLVGAAIASVGHSIDSIEWKERWILSSGLPMEQKTKVLTEFYEVTPPKAIFAARAVSAVAFIMASVVIYLVGQRVFSTIAGLAAVVFMSLSPMQHQLATEVLADGPQLLLLMMAVLLQLRLSDTLVNRERLAPPWSATMLGVILALLVNTKISGLAATPIAVAALVGAPWITWISRTDETALQPPSRNRLLQFALAGAVTFVVFVLVAVAINPTLYRQFGVPLIQMVFQRIEVANAQSRIFFSYAMPTLLVKLAAFTLGIFEESLGLGLIALWCFVVGVVSLPSWYRERRLSTLIFLVNSLGWVVAIWLTFRLNTARYLLPVAPFIALLAGAGVDSCLRRFRTISRKPLPRLGVMGLATAVVVVATIGWPYYSLNAFIKRNPDWYISASKESARAQAQFQADAQKVRDEDGWIRDFDSE